MRGTIKLSEEMEPSWGGGGGTVILPLTSSKGRTNILGKLRSFPDIYELMSKKLREW